MKRTLLCLLLALTMLLAAGCADWEVTEDPLGSCPTSTRMKTKNRSQSR